MPGTGWTPSIVPIVPYGADQTVYLVVDCFGRLGTAYRETDIEPSMIGVLLASWLRPQVPEMTLIRVSSVAPRPRAIAGPSA